MKPSVLLFLALATALLVAGCSWEYSSEPVVPDWPAAEDGGSAAPGEALTFVLGARDHDGDAFIMDAYADGVPVAVKEGDVSHAPGDTVTFRGGLLSLTFPGFPECGSHDVRIHLHGYHLPHMMAAWLVQVMDAPADSTAAAHRETLVTGVDVTTGYTE